MGVAQLLMTVQSVVVVYHLASLQGWLQGLQNLQSDAEVILSETAEGDLRRVRAARRIDSALHGYPWIQVLFLFVVIATLGALTILETRYLSIVPWYYVQLPAALLVGIYLFSSATIYMIGRRLASSIARRLE